MAAWKPDQTRGFIVPDPKLAIAVRDLTDADLATATQGGGVPGVPVSDPPSLMALRASGEVWAGDTLEVQAIKGGGASPGTSAARATWSGGTTEGATVRGWLPYNVACGFFFLATAATDIPGTVSLNTSQPCVLRRSNGDVVTAVVSDNSGTVTIAVLLYDASVGKYRPSYARYDSGGAAYVYDTRDAYTWVGEVVTTGDTTTDPSCPCLLELPTGRLLLFFVSTQSYAGGNSYYSVGYSYSDDGGATWTLAAVDAGARVASSGDPVVQLQAVYVNGYATLLIVQSNGTSTAFTHFVSSDDGASWTEVASALPDVAFSPQLIACDDGTVLMIYVKGGNGYMRIARKLEPYGDFLNPTAISPSGGGIPLYRETYDTLAATVLEDRTIGILAVTEDDGTNAPALRYVRLPQDVSGPSDPIIVPYYANSVDADALDYGGGTGAVQRIASARSACCFGSQLLLTFDTTEATSYAAAQLFGGYSSIDWNGPSFGLYSAVGSLLRYGAWWDAAYKPSSIALWTVAGAGTEGSSVDRLLSYDFSGGASTRTNTRTGVAGADVWVWMRVRVDSGGSLATLAVGAILQSADGVTDYQVEVRLSTNGIRLYDTHGAATKGTDATLSTASAMIDVLASLTSTGRCVVWYKAATSNVWIQGPYGNAAAKGASPAAVSRAVWGCVTASTSKSTWAHVGSMCDDWNWSLPTSVSEPNKPRVTFGREVSIWPVFLADGTAISAASEPAAKGDTWTLAPSFTYPAANLDPLVNPSPSLVWRSDDDQAEQILGWDLGAEDGPDSALLGLYLQGANFLQLLVEQDDGAGGWTQLADLSTVVISGDFTRSGFRVTAGTSAVGTRAIGRDELAGSWAVLDDGGDLYYVKILRNSQGTWNTTAGVLTATLTLDATAAEVAALPTSGDIQILAPEVAVVFPAMSATRQQWRIRIPARTYISAPEAYHQAAVLLLGPYLPVGFEWSNARTASMEPLQRITETETGKRTVAALTSRPRRTVEVVWTDALPGVDVLGDEAVPQAVAAHYSSTDPDELGIPIAHEADPRQVEDLLLRAQGALYPVVLLTRVPLIAVGDSGGQAIITGRDQLLYGQIVNGSTRTEPISNEDVKQVTTISALRIEEVK